MSIQSCCWSKLSCSISANQKNYPDLGSDASSVWNFCTHLLDFIIHRETSGDIAKYQLFSQATFQLTKIFC